MKNPEFGGIGKKVGKALQEVASVASIVLPALLISPDNGDRSQFEDTGNVHSISFFVGNKAEARVRPLSMEEKQRMNKLLAIAAQEYMKTYDNRYGRTEKVSLEVQSVGLGCYEVIATYESSKFGSGSVNLFVPYNVSEKDVLEKIPPLYIREAIAFERGGGLKDKQFEVRDPKTGNITVVRVSASAQARMMAGRTSFSRDGTFVFFGSNGVDVTDNGKNARVELYRDIRVLDQPHLIACVYERGGSGMRLLGYILNADPREGESYVIRSMNDRELQMQCLQ